MRCFELALYVEQEIVIAIPSHPKYYLRPDFFTYTQITFMQFNMFVKMFYLELYTSKYYFIRSLMKFPQ